MHPQLSLVAALCICIGTGAACSESEDPLSAEAIDRLTRERGDGKGTKFSGSYDIEVQDSDCDCPARAREAGEDSGYAGLVCLALALPPEALGGTGSAPFVSQSDGTLGVSDLGNAAEIGIELETVELSGALVGPVDANGDFEVANRAEFLLGTVQVLEHLEGSFDDDDFVATLTRRVKLEGFDGLVLDDGGSTGDAIELTALDCRSWTELRGEQL